MKNLLNLIIIFFILYISYDCLSNNIEGFSNDAFQYLEQLHTSIINNNFDNLNISDNLSVSNNSNLNKGFDGDVIIDNNLVINGNITGKNGYVNNTIINDKWSIYTNKDALAIGRKIGNNISPALYSNPGTKENLWVFENISDNQFWYYSWNTENTGHYGKNSLNMDDILINNNNSTFIPYDKL